MKSFVGEGVKLDCVGGFGVVMMVIVIFGMVVVVCVVECLVEGCVLWLLWCMLGNV